MEDITPIHKIDTDSIKKTLNKPSELTTPKLVGIFVGLIFLGAITGFGISAMQSMMRAKSLTSTSTSGTNETPKEVAGIQGKKNFKDSATGILKDGGFEGEGSHHLERPGGKSQNVYVTSSTVDLSQYVNHKITVHGETFTAEKAGWLMDVGLVEVLD